MKQYKKTLSKTLLLLLSANILSAHYDLNALIIQVRTQNNPFTSEDTVTIGTETYSVTNPQILQAVKEAYIPLNQTKPAFYGDHLGIRIQTELKKMMNPADIAEIERAEAAATQSKETKTEPQRAAAESVSIYNFTEFADKVVSNNLDGLTIGTKIIIDGQEYIVGEKDLLLAAAKAWKSLDRSIYTPQLQEKAQKLLLTAFFDKRLYDGEYYIESETDGTITLTHIQTRKVYSARIYDVNLGKAPDFPFSLKAACHFWQRAIIKK